MGVALFLWPILAERIGLLLPRELLLFGVSVNYPNADLGSFSTTVCSLNADVILFILRNLHMRGDFGSMDSAGRGTGEHLLFLQSLLLVGKRRGQSFILRELQASCHAHRLPFSPCFPELDPR